MISPRIIGWLWVILQFGLLGALAVWVMRSGALAWPEYLLLAGSGALGMWALTSNRPGNFNIHPEPHRRGRLIRHGPYRWIRHPMYSAVLLFGAAMALALDQIGGWCLWAGLVAALWQKAQMEEHWMRQRHPDYAEYQTRSRRFIPGLW